MSERKGLEDYDFSGARNLAHSDVDAPPHGIKGTVLFRVVEGAPVALYQACDGDQAKLVVQRNDLFQYSGGYEWGYRGTGPQSLSHALAALVYPSIFDHGVLADKAREILENVVSLIPKGTESDIPVSHIYQECGEPKLVE